MWGVLAATLISASLGLILGITSEEALTTYGPLGIISAALLWFAKGTVDRLVMDRDKALEQRDQMMNDVLNDFMPVIRRAVDVLEKREQLDAEVLAVMRGVREELGRR